MAARPVVMSLRIVSPESKTADGAMKASMISCCELVTRAKSILPAGSPFRFGRLVGDVQKCGEETRLR
jgi:hypothetical protein